MHRERSTSANQSLKLVYRADLIPVEENKGRNYQPDYCPLCLPKTFIRKKCDEILGELGYHTTRKENTRILIVVAFRAAMNYQAECGKRGIRSLRSTLRKGQSSYLGEVLFGEQLGTVAYSVRDAVSRDWGSDVFGRSRLHSRCGK
jgi:hypothetical protein